MTCETFGCRTKALWEIAQDLQDTTGVPLTYRTLYRWIDQMEEVAS